MSRHGAPRPWAVRLEEDSRRPECRCSRARSASTPGIDLQAVTARGPSGLLVFAERHFDCRRCPTPVGLQLPAVFCLFANDVPIARARDVTLDEGLRLSCTPTRSARRRRSRTLQSTADAFELATSTDGTGRRPEASCHGPGRPGRSARTPFRMRGSRRRCGPLRVAPWRLLLEPQRPVPCAAVLGPRPPKLARACPRRDGGTASPRRQSTEIAGRPHGGVAGAPSHSWFVGFARQPDRSVRRPVIVENGGYGARAAVPLAGDVVSAARSLGMIPAPP